MARKVDLVHKQKRARECNHYSGLHLDVFTGKPWMSDQFMKIPEGNLPCMTNDIARWVVQANIKGSGSERRIENVVALGDSTPDLRG
jgi:hypothetical protein